MVLEAIKLLRASLPATIRIQTELAETPAVLANSTAVHQAIMNLGTNAWHAMRGRPGLLEFEMGVVAVDADFVKTHPDLQVGSYVRLSVSDTGCGMDRATMDRIFEPFFTTKGVGEGTGLGLAMVHGIMKSHDGCVSVSSRPGEGAVFQLYFPVFAAAAVVPDFESMPVRHGRGERILFVDDEEFLARVGETMLERLGYAVTRVHSAQQAIAAVRAQTVPFDLVITDLTMPAMDGISLGRQLLQMQPGLAIILTTGYSGVLTAQKVRALGFRELLAKPIEVWALAEAVDRVMRPKTAAEAGGGAAAEIEIANAEI